MWRFVRMMSHVASNSHPRSTQGSTGARYPLMKMNFVLRCLGSHFLLCTGWLTNLFRILLATVPILRRILLSTNTILLDFLCISQHFLPPKFKEVCRIRVKFKAILTVIAIAVKITQRRWGITCGVHFLHCCRH